MMRAVKPTTSISVGLLAICSSGTALGQTYDGAGSPKFIPHTLQEALASAYLTNPTLQQERAKLRATDEQVPEALAGWRPTIQANLAGSYYKGFNAYGAQSASPGSPFGTPASNRSYATPGYSAGVTIQQPIYQGGKTTAKTHQAENTVRAERAQLIATEQQVFLDTVDAYIGVVQAEQLLQINMNNKRVLSQQLEATRIRFRDGEITKTDVAQAQAAVSYAEANLRNAEGSLQAAQATYLQVVGIPAAPNLKAPQPLIIPLKNEAEIVRMAGENSPNVINSLFMQAAKRDAFSVAMSALMPQISATAAYQRVKNQGYGSLETDNKYALLTLSLPIYQGGAEYAAVREARQEYLAARRATDVERRRAAQLASANWQQMRAYRDSLTSNREAIYANVVALDGIEQQAVVGTATTFAVLQQQQTLLQSQTALIQNLAGLVKSSYTVAAAIGRLTASDLKINVPLYDEKAYYKAVRHKLWGISDVATQQPGR
ncbi:TolC family outer membrane protein [Candidatus Kirkpatrickella diaphorinae]|uniref:TolC family outer membrane protein n=1 Tax=Candidatus Kirkpatrickella diaphorinae TaxID=2984322 RepID=A0ABY6GJW8_9PROT|nr:TolC family outer membrane protein [Candidatus Kirkpatrickella diaphorinae]UYH51832.1 TolC family outer membrane protein [Candidatus Kirkpatrickella diaphorinae]